MFYDESFVLVLWREITRKICLAQIQIVTKEQNVDEYLD